MGVMVGGMEGDWEGEVVEGVGVGLLDGLAVGGVVGEKDRDGATVGLDGAVVDGRRDGLLEGVAVVGLDVGL